MKNAQISSLLYEVGFRFRGVEYKNWSFFFCAKYCTLNCIPVTLKMIIYPAPSLSTYLTKNLPCA